ncbi:MAG: hypothetical protein ABS76_17670 [Pelagibacterium sp. SCN 64-44]|nr:MAG: hypothetical protein ABS76_17670 [Pelagibacterium sp. SCN 64-44]
MADTPGKDTPPNDAKPQDRSGPVKPPVLEGTARPAAGEKPAEAASTSQKPSPAASRTAPEKPAPAPKSSGGEQNGGAPWLAGLLGGLIGLGAAYGLAWFGLWPTTPQTQPPADPRLAQFSAAIAELQGETQTAQGQLSTLDGRLSGLETEIAALPAATEPGPVDETLAQDLAALTQRVESLAAGRPDADTGLAAQNAETIAALETALAELQREAGDTQTRMAAIESQLGTLAETANAAAAGEDQSARLPLILSGLENAFAGGRSYEAELSALRRAWPDAAIPENLSAAAATGLPRPDAVAQRLNAAIPDMLAGRPIASDANWQDGAMDWVRGIVAMRPAGEAEGDDPEARIARLEAAMARRDFTAAAAELNALPDAMRQAAGPAAGDIATLAAAEGFLADLRSRALGTEGAE